MTLRKATLLLTCLTSLAVFGVLFGISRHVIRTSFLSLEQQAGERDILRVQNALGDEVAKLDTILVDWAVWDDSYHFLRKPTRAFVESNLNDRTVASLRLSAVAFLDPRGNTVWATGFNPAKGTEAPLPEGLGRWLAPGTPFSQPVPLEDRVKGFLLLEQGIFLVASSPVLKSDGSGPPVGFLVMCRALADTDVAAISDRLRLSVLVHRADAPLPPEMDVAGAGGLMPGESRIVPVNPETLVAVSSMKGLDGRVAFHVGVRSPRDVVLIGTEALARNNIALAVCGVLFALVLGLFLERRVLSRLAALRGQVEAIGAIGHELGRVSMPGTDELSGLASRINDMLSEIERSRADLARRYQEKQEQEQYLQRLLDSIQAGVLLVDPASHCVVAVNEFAAGLMGRTKQEVVGQMCHGFLCPAERGKCPVADLGASGEQAVRQLLRADGTTIPVLKTVSYIVREGRELLLETFTEVESLVRAQEALARSEETYRTLFMNTGTATVLLAEDTTITLANQEFEKLSGYTRQEAENRMSWTEFFAPEDVEWMLRHHVKRRENPELAPRNFEARIRTRSGEERIVWLTVALVPGTDTTVAALEDITDRKRAEEQLRHQAFHDALTGLPNRLLLHDRMDRVLESARREGQQAGVLLMDLDRFKDINDTLGHSQGDELLRQVAGRLSGAVRRVDTVARLGGDEFVVVVDSPASEQAVEKVGRHILAVMVQPFPLASGPVHMGISIGMALFPGHGDSPEAMLKNADLAMYRAKEAGRNTCAFYTSGLNDLAVQRLQAQAWLRRALAEDGLAVHYQPKVSGEGGIIGAEALVRLRREDGSLVSPAVFIPVAEETGLIGAVTEAVLRDAARCARRWRNVAGPDFAVAVNLSARLLAQPGLAGRVAAILQEAGCQAGALEMEITETALASDMDTVARNLEELAALGSAIALDDFGKEYSSLAYIKRLPITAIKIDQVFIDGIPDDENDTAIVRSVLSMAGDLELRVVAEGVETAEQVDFLLALGCSEFQGYYFARPVPAEEMEALLEAGRLPLG